MFLTVLDRSWPFMTVHDRSRAFPSVPERSRAFSIFLWAFSIMKRSKTVRNGQERSGTVRNGQERWTVWNDHTVQDHGPKRLKNHGHGTSTVRSSSRVKNERNTVFFCINSLVFLILVRTTTPDKKMYGGNHLFLAIFFSQKSEFLDVYKPPTEG